MREVVEADGQPDKKLLKLLKKAEGLPNDTKEQRDAIRACCRAIPPTCP